jgi:hypothetical protein
MGGNIGMENKMNKTSYTHAELLDLDFPDLIKIKDEQICFIEGDYWIELNRIRTRAHLIEWIHHMTGKKWVTGDMIGEFIEKVCKYRKWDVYSDV